MRRWWVSPPPAAGLEIAAGRVTALAVSARRDGPVVAAHATEPLPEGAVTPGLTAENLADPAAVGDAVRRALGAVGRPRRVALVVPDAVAKVSIVRFEKVPARREDLEALIRHQVRKAVPFPIETAQVAFCPGVASEAGHEFVVAVARREVVEAYEGVCRRAGADPGLVDLASFGLANVVILGDRRAGGAPAGDWLLVHLTPQASTLLIVRGEALIFYRHRSVADGEPLVDLVHQTAMYYEDRLNGAGFARVVLAASGEVVAREAAGARRTLEERLAAPVEVLDPVRAASLTDRIVASPDLLAALAPPLGAVLREAA
jgi:type IV pilus assembly protein PilM